MKLPGSAVVACLLSSSLGCSSPTLWIGTARSDVAGQPASEQAPWRAADSGAALRPSAASTTTSPGLDAGAGPTMTGNAPALASATGGTSSTSAPAAASGSTTPDAGRGAHDGTDADADDAGAPARLGEPSQAPLTPQRLPSAAGPCPDMNGDGMYMFSAGGRSLLVQIYMRPDAKSVPAPGGPLIMYFHSLGTSSSEVASAFTQKSIDRVVAQGGVVASFNDTPCLSCGLAEDVVWYDEDDVVSDQVVACAIQKARIDTRRIHSIGFSSGALHSMHLVLARSGYIASVISYSGGMPLSVTDPQDPMNKVPALLAFGREGVDNAVADFNVGSHSWHDTYTPKGYYSMMCDHDGGHVIPTELPAHALRFFLDHPYRVQPEPYLTSIPSEYPGYCRNQ